MAKKKTQLAKNIEQEGWGKSPASQKWHYFPAKETTSLCSRIGFFFGERETGLDASPSNCAACKKKLAAQQKRAAKEATA
jgi:hypothetical protein